MFPSTMGYGAPEGTQLCAARGEPYDSRVRLLHHKTSQTRCATYGPFKLFKFVRRLVNLLSRQHHRSHWHEKQDCAACVEKHKTEEDEKHPLESSRVANKYNAPSQWSPL